MTLAELRYGVNCFAKPESNHIAIDNFTSSIPVVGIDQNVARIFADIKAQLRKEGTLIEDLDLMIAATARAHNLLLVTNNTEHFQRVPGLVLENWIRS
jgi:predicted nucleic acid-binding protein